MQRFLAWGNLLFFDASLRLIEPLDFTFSKKQFKYEESGQLLLPHLLCPLSNLWPGLEGDAGGVALIAFSLHFCQRKGDIFMLSMRKWMKQNQHSDSIVSYSSRKRGEINPSRFGECKTKGYLVGFE